MTYTNAFDLQLKTRLIFGNNKIDEIGAYAKTTGGQNVLLVTDPGIVASGMHRRALNSLHDAGFKVFVFDDVIQNPTTETVNACTKFAADKNIDLIVGFGGGSSIDAAKGCNFILTNGGAMQDYWGKGKATKPMLPLIAVPTTAGTGSECQSFALISDAETHRKMACGDPKATPVIAILEPTLTLSQPPHVTACTGMDAIAHALESAVTKKKTPVSWLFSREAFRLTFHAAGRIVKDSNDLRARGDMLLGASYAGLAIESSMLGSAPAAANPLTANFDITHGQAVGLMLPHIVRLNSRDGASAETYRQLATDTALVNHGTSAAESIDILVNELYALLNAFGLKTTLSDFGIQEETVTMLAGQAAEQWTGNFNPIELTTEDYHELYNNALASELKV